MKGFPREIEIFYIVIGICIRCFFLYLYFDALISWSLADPRGKPLGLSNSQRQQTTHLQECFSKSNPLTQSPHTLSPLWGSHTQGHYPLAQITPGSGIRQQRTALYPRAAISTQASQSKPAQPASPVPSQGKHNKGSCSYFPPTPSPLDQYLYFPTWAWVEQREPFSWDLSITNYLFSGSCLLICWPYHT